MGHEYRPSQGSYYEGFSYNSTPTWEDGTDDLREEDVWGGHDASSSWNHSSVGYNDISHGYNDAQDDYGSSNRANVSKSWLSTELESANGCGYNIEHVGLGFAALEVSETNSFGSRRESNGGWAPGFSTRKVRIPQLASGSSGSAYANGWHDHGSSSSRSGIPQSAPVSMPAWPKKCGHEASNANADADESTSDDDDEADENNYDDSSDDDYRSGRRGRLAPHEIVDREYARSTTFSVIEGAGRTLKGSDLRRVRNAVWSCTGFED